MSVVDEQVRKSIGMGRRRRSMALRRDVLGRRSGCDRGKYVGEDTCYRHLPEESFG